MNNQIEERIKIAKSFKSKHNWEEKSEERIEKTLNRYALLNYKIVILLLFFVIVASGVATIQTGSFSVNWAKAGLLISMTMVLSFNAPLLYIELLLHEHISKIKNMNLEFEEKRNIELQDIIMRLNKRKKYRYLIGVPVIVILISAGLQVLDINPYWDKFPPLVLVVGLYLITQISYDIFKIKKNLGSVVNPML